MLNCGGFGVFEILIDFLHCTCLMVIVKEKDRLVNLRCLIPGVLRPLALPFEKKEFRVCITIDKWDKEFYKLPGG